MTFLRILPAALGLLPFAPHAAADVTLAPLFRDGAVLQHGKPIAIWGTADAGEKVTASFLDQRRETAADAKGNWRVDLDPLRPSSVPETLSVKANNTVQVRDILVGDVWLCSGQSNMAWPVKASRNFAEESAAANYPQIRCFRVETKTLPQPSETASGHWETCSPATVGAFTGVGYFFARDLHQALQIPIGVIDASYGGTPVEAWMSGDALRSNPEFSAVFQRWSDAMAAYPERAKRFEPELAAWKATQEADRKAGKATKSRQPRGPVGPDSKMAPSGLYHAMIHPLIPYGLRGFLWYQGEANAPLFNEYGKLFTTLIRTWRGAFGQGDLPFFFVQLANWNVRTDPTGVQWAFLREAQTAALRLPATAMAVTIDVGDPRRIHPENKQEVGRRLALIALAQVYGRTVESAGPSFRSARVEGSEMRITFARAEKLILQDLNPSGFELAGSDKVFHPATARIEGTGITLAAPAVPQPVAARYAWSNNPQSSLTAAPFRTDDWPAPAQALTNPYLWPLTASQPSDSP
ncbi:MAG TPA: sialate O-acetylesterase [Terrimicrobiaceae bacterium]|nr:sialate O-acetylesterase [Terrimicrobiaceae bacterium]